MTDGGGGDGRRHPGTARRQPRLTTRTFPLLGSRSFRRGVPSSASIASMSSMAVVWATSAARSLAADGLFRRVMTHIPFGEMIAQLVADLNLVILDEG
jgi:hypothetical protein